jgi:hypothetical protein
MYPNSNINGVVCVSFLRIYLYLEQINTSVNEVCKTKIMWIYQSMSVKIEQTRVPFMRC